MRNLSRQAAIILVGGFVWAPMACAEDKEPDQSGLRLLWAEYHGYVDFRYDRTYADDAFEIVFEVDKRGDMVPATYKIKTPGAAGARQDANSYIEIRNSVTRPGKGTDSRPGCPPPKLASKWEQITVDEVNVASDRILVQGEQILPDIVIGLGLESCHGSGTETKKGQTGRSGVNIQIPREKLAQSATQTVKFGGKGWKYPDWTYTLSPYNPASGVR
jgi:hypothetical protein